MYLKIVLEMVVVDIQWLGMDVTHSSINSLSVYTKKRSCTFDRFYVLRLEALQEKHLLKIVHGYTELLSYIV